MENLVISRLETLDMLNPINKGQIRLIRNMVIYIMLDQIDFVRLQY